MNRIHCSLNENNSLKLLEVQNKTGLSINAIINSVVGALSAFEVQETIDFTPPPDPETPTTRPAKFHKIVKKVTFFTPH